jgi:hypothetical protein
MRMTRVCAHTTPGQRKARPWLDGGVLSLWVPAANRSSATHVEQRNDTIAWKRSAHGDDDSGTCKRLARLDGRLSSDGGSARRREGAAGNIQTASSQGSVLPRLEGRVHNKVKGVEAHLALLDTMAKKVRWSRERRLGARLDAGEEEQHDAVSSRSGSYAAVAT